MDDELIVNGKFIFLPSNLSISTVILLVKLWFVYRLDMQKHTWKTQTIPQWQNEGGFKIWIILIKQVLYTLPCQYNNLILFKNVGLKFFFYLQQYCGQEVTSATFYPWKTLYGIAYDIIRHIFYSVLFSINTYTQHIQQWTNKSGLPIKHSIILMWNSFYSRA